MKPLKLIVELTKQEAKQFILLAERREGRSFLTKLLPHALVTVPNIKVLRSIYSDKEWKR